MINEEIIVGKPLELERQLQMEITQQILSLSSNNYENVCDNMRMIADIIEIIEEHINNNEITLKYNPMGEWYYEESEEI